MQLLFRPTKPIWDEYKQGLWMLKVRTTFQIVQSQVPGVLEYELAPGYITDFRSGPSIINPFIPKIGSPNLAHSRRELPWIPFSFES